MPKREVVLAGGLIFTMTGDDEPVSGSLVISSGRVSKIIQGPYEPDDERLPQNADFIDVSGLYVAPGFIDIHIHTEYPDDKHIVEHALLRQGVTSALSGNCGSGPLFSDSEAMHPNPFVHLYSLVGNRVLRKKAGHPDIYTPASREQIDEMSRLLSESMMFGAMGVSFGLEYAPGTSSDEIGSLAQVTAEYDGIVTVHTRFDDDRCVEAVREAINISRMFGVRVEISHLGSMTTYYTQECINTIEAARREGLKVNFDCYPYSAFCTNIGSAVFDDGFVKRWRGKGPEYLEAASGRFRGQRLTWETFREMRREEPEGMIIAHIMNEDEVAACIASPNCIIGSDTFYEGEGAHPRLSGTFPRAFRITREHGYQWKDALKKATVFPAEALGIDAGRIAVGAIADIVVFDPCNYEDRATFQNPFLPPAGVKLVLVAGETAVYDGVIKETPNGDFRRHPRRCMAVSA